MPVLNLEPVRQTVAQVWPFVRFLNYQVSAIVDFYIFIILMVTTGQYASLQFFCAISQKVTKTCQFFNFSRVAAMHHVRLVLHTFGAPITGMGSSLSLCTIPFKSMHYFWYMQYFVFYPLGFKTPIHTPVTEVLGDLTSKIVSYLIGTPKTLMVAETCRLSH